MADDIRWSSFRVVPEAGEGSALSFDLAAVAALQPYCKPGKGNQSYNEYNKHKHPLPVTTDPGLVSVRCSRSAGNCNGGCRSATRNVECACRDSRVATSDR